MKPLLSEPTRLGRALCWWFGHPHTVLIFTGKHSGVRLGIDSSDPSARHASIVLGPPTHHWCERCGAMTPVEDAS